jgi:hypothetical protein
VIEEQVIQDDIEGLVGIPRSHVAIDQAEAFSCLWGELLLFFASPLEHGLREIDADDVVTDLARELRERQRDAAAPARQIEHALGRPPAHEFGVEANVALVVLVLEIVVVRALVNGIGHGGLQKSTSSGVQESPPSLNAATAECRIRA